MRIIVTDLTRFSDTHTDVCLAGIDTNTGECIRPLQYLKRRYVEEEEIFPGSILELNGTKPATIVLPHSEDFFYAGNVVKVGICTSDEFLDVLQQTLSDSVSKGFGAVVHHHQTHFDTASPPSVSIITIKVEPRNISIVPDKFNNDTIKIIFTDADGNEFFYRSIADIGYYQYAKKIGINALSVKQINSHIKSQNEIYLRVGLGRLHDQGDGRVGYWIQVNGIYTFPDYIEEIRSY